MPAKATKAPALSKAANAYVYPGRGVGPAPGKLPAAKSLFADLSKAWLDSKPDKSAVPEGVDPKSHAWAVTALGKGSLHAAYTPKEMKALWAVLEPLWRQGWYGTPAALTQGKRLGEKFATWMLASGGAAQAVQGLMATWELGSGAPASPDIDHNFHYLERQFAGFSALRALRERLAGVEQAQYDEAVAACRKVWPKLPVHLQAAVAFLLPTERDLADQALSRTEAFKKPYKQTVSVLNMSPVDASYWPPYVAFLAWSLQDEKDFARTKARRFFGGDAAWAVACATLHPALLDEDVRYTLERAKLLA